jgi:uncharacterized protein YciI
MKHFIIEVTYNVPAEQLGETVGLHRSFLQTGYERGWILCSGPMLPRTGGMIVARAPSLEELQRFFAADPYLLKNLAVYRFIEFDPIKRQPFLEEWATAPD